MKKTNEIYCSNDHIAAIIIIFVSALMIACGVIVLVDPSAAVLGWLCIICGIGMAYYGLKMLISRYGKKIIFDGRKVEYYQNGKKTKAIFVDEVRSIKVFIIVVHGTKIKEIIIDDGTFKYYGGNPYFILSLEELNAASWISLRYTAKKLEVVKTYLPNCSVEEIDATRWND